jgi:bifunctional UDP-N-acetylglucosamine pyrophosphorylase/glucosamine-1-phosphate N-acetyltransferase
MRRRILDRLMTGGVTVDRSRHHLRRRHRDDRGRHRAASGVILEGRTVVGAECVINTGCHVADTTLGDRVLLKPYCVLASSIVEDEARSAHSATCARRATWREGQGRQLRGAQEVPDRARLQGAAPVLRGRHQMGDGVNIGAGTITCNYDGWPSTRR